MSHIACESRPFSAFVSPLAEAEPKGLKVEKAFALRLC